MVVNCGRISLCRVGGWVNIEGYTLAVEEMHFVRRRVFLLWRRGRIPSGGYTLAVEEVHFVWRRGVLSLLRKVLNLPGEGAFRPEEGEPSMWRRVLNLPGGGAFHPEEGAEFAWKEGRILSANRRRVLSFVVAEDMKWYHCCRVGC